MTGLSEEDFVSIPLGMSIHTWSHYPTDLPSNVTLPLAAWLCSVSYKSCPTTLSPGGSAGRNLVLLAA